MKPDKIIINKFLEHLRSIGRTCCVKLSYPDDENRNEKDIDCVCGNIAIEHTSIDFIKGARSKDKILELFQNYLYVILIDLGLACNLTLILPNDLQYKSKKWKILADQIIDTLCYNMNFLNSKKLEIIQFKDSFIYAKTNKTGQNKAIFHVDSEKTGFQSEAKCKLIEKLNKLSKYEFLTRILLIEINDLHFDIESSLVDLIINLAEEKLLKFANEIWIVETTGRGISFTDYSHLLK